MKLVCKEPTGFGSRRACGGTFGALPSEEERCVICGCLMSSDVVVPEFASFSYRRHNSTSCVFLCGDAFDDIMSWVRRNIFTRGSAGIPLLPVNLFYK